ARVRDPWRSGVTDQDDEFSGAHPRHDDLTLSGFVVLVQRVQTPSGGNVVRAKERARVSRVLAVDDVRAREEIESSAREIAEVTQRRRHEHQLTDDLTLIHGVFL